MAMHLTLIDTENNLERCQFFFNRTYLKTIVQKNFNIIINENIGSTATEMLNKT